MTRDSGWVTGAIVMQFLVGFCAVGASRQPLEIQTLHARRVDERELPLNGESGIKIPNVAETVMEPSEDLRTEAHIQR